MPVPALHAQSPLAFAANALHGLRLWLALRLQQGCCGAPFGRRQKILSL